MPATVSILARAPLQPYGACRWVFQVGGVPSGRVMYYLIVARRAGENLRRDPRVVLSFQAKEYSGQGLWPYAVVRGRVDRITEGGALDVMDRLAEHYIGPGQRYPMRDVPDGVVLHVRIDRVYGQGPWAQGH
jgi:hypothetical protein